MNFSIRKIIIPTSEEQLKKFYKKFHRDRIFVYQEHKMNEWNAPFEINKQRRKRKKKEKKNENIGVFCCVC